MSARARSPQSYYELNYLISEEKALHVRDHVANYLELHEDSVGRPNFSWPVHTLCLDSDDFTFYRQAINDVEHRRQLRVRYRSLNPEAPAHLEIKRRLADAVVRERCAVRLEDVPLVLSGQLLTPHRLLQRDPVGERVLEHFVELAQRFQAKPKLHIAFLREAYTSADGTVRVTLDRQIQCQATSAQGLEWEFRDPCGLFPSKVLLELSCVERFPNWFREMAEHFNLAQCEADKFVAGISALGSRVFGLPG